MQNNIISMSQPRFVSQKEAAKVTGCSLYFIKEGVKAGRIPHLRDGRRIYIDLPLFMEELDKQSRNSLLKL